MVGRSVVDFLFFVLLFCCCCFVLLVGIVCFRSSFCNFLMHFVKHVLTNPDCKHWQAAQRRPWILFFSNLNLMCFLKTRISKIYCGHQLLLQKACKNAPTDRAGFPRTSLGSVWSPNGACWIFPHASLGLSEAPKQACGIWDALLLTHFQALIWRIVHVVYQYAMSDHEHCGMRVCCVVLWCVVSCCVAFSCVVS